MQQTTQAITPAEAFLLAYPHKANDKILLAYALKGLIYKNALQITPALANVKNSQLHIQLGGNHQCKNLKSHERILTDFFTVNEKKKVGIKEFISSLPTQRTGKFKTQVTTDLIKVGYFEEGWLSDSISTKGEQKAKELRTQLRAAKCFLKERQHSQLSVANMPSIMALGACMVLLEENELVQLNSFFQEMAFNAIGYAEVGLDMVSSGIDLFEGLDMALEYISVLDSVEVIRSIAELPISIFEGLVGILGSLSN